MRIAFDLDDTLIAAYFPAEAASLSARLLLRERLRLGTKALFQALRSKGHEIWIYTTSCRKKSYIKWLFRLHGLRLDGVVNQDIHNRIVKVSVSKYPLAFGIDVLVDNSKGTEQEGQCHGFRTIIIDPDDANWIETVLTEVNETAQSL